MKSIFKRQQSIQRMFPNQGIRERINRQHCNLDLRDQSKINMKMHVWNLLMGVLNKVLHRGNEISVNSRSDERLILTKCRINK